MLRDLHLRNLAVVAEATLELGAGFNVLSGETGAGKSIVIDSLTLLAGTRASTDLIRTDAETLSVTGVFEGLPETAREQLLAAGIELGGEPGEEVVVRREVSRSGRNRVFVNDQPVTLKLVSELAPALLRIHGQREELGLVAPELQRTWLDRCGGEEAPRLLAATAEAHRAFRRLDERLQALTGDARGRAERIDFLRFQLEEIDTAAPRAGEEEELRAEREVLRHGEAISAALSHAGDELFEGENAAYELLARAEQGLEKITVWEPQAAPWSTELRELRIRCGELAGTLRQRLGEIEADPRRLDAVEDRLALLERLMRKHGASCAEMLARRAELAAELEELAGDLDSSAELESAREQALESYRRAALELSAARARWAEELGARVARELAELALGRARFAVDLERRPRAGSALVIEGQAIDFGEAGIDQVVYRFSPNPGEELRPLARVASGGELSRLYLAVQLAVRDGSRAPGSHASSATLVFDEVDTGLGGAEAALLGQKLRRLAQGGQVLAVTHLPQVASCADHHYKVSKLVQGGRTLTRVEPLVPARRVEEVARMLAGSEITELSLSHARELIEGAAV